MENMHIYNAVRQVPENAKKKISGGRLKGMTDINPMWRIQALTEQFGPCGTGWKYIIREKRIEQGPGDEASAFVDIDLYYKTGDGLWSEAVPGTGGAAFVSKERNGLYLSDECFKMALTDALSVACKALGMGADVYWEAGRSKYNQTSGGVEPESQDGRTSPPPAYGPLPVCSCCGKSIRDAKNGAGEIWKSADIAVYTERMFGKQLCIGCMNKENRK